MKLNTLLLSALTLIATAQCAAAPLSLAQAILMPPLCGDQSTAGITLTATGGSPTLREYEYTLYDSAGSTPKAGPIRGDSATFSGLPFATGFTYKIDDLNGNVLGPVPGKTNFEMFNSAVPVTLSIFDNSVIVSSNADFSFPADNRPFLVLDGTQFDPISSSPFSQTIPVNPGSTHILFGVLFCPSQSTFAFAFTAPVKSVYMQKIELVPAPCTDGTIVTTTITGAGGSGSFIYELQLPTGELVTNTTGVFTYDATGTVSSLPFKISDANDLLNATVNHFVRNVQSNFPFTIIVTPPCSRGTGSVCVQGTGSTQGTTVRLVSDTPPYDKTETLLGGPFSLTFSGVNASAESTTYQLFIQGECEGANFVNFSVPLLSPITFDATAHGNCAGEASITVSNVTGGNGSYLYSSDGVTFCPNPTLTGLTSGQTYTVSVIDSNCAAVIDPNGCTTTLNPDACIASKVVTISAESTVVITNAQGIGPVCGAQFGSVSFIPNGGTGFYTQACATLIQGGNAICVMAPAGTPFQAGQTLSIPGLVPGTYNLSVTDTAQCIGTAQNVVVPTTSAQAPFQLCGDAHFRNNVAIDGNLDVAGDTTTRDLTVKRNLRVDGFAVIQQELVGNLFIQGVTQAQDVTVQGNFSFHNAFVTPAVVSAVDSVSFGDVLVVSTTADRQVEISPGSSQEAVVGVTFHTDAGSQNILMSVGGEFQVKVDGPVRRGQYLRTSFTPGTAIVASEGNRAFAIATSEDLSNDVKLVWARFALTDSF